MATDKEIKKSILIDITIDSNKLTKSITSLTIEVGKLKDANKALAKEAKAAQESGNEAQFKKKTEQIVLNEKAIRDLSEQMKRLKNEEDVQSKAVNAEKLSYEQLLRTYEIGEKRLKTLAGTIKVNKDGTFTLTEEYKKAQIELKKVDDVLKQFDVNIGNGKRNVGNYAQALEDVFQKTGLFGGSITKLRTAFEGLQQGIQITKAGFISLKTAFISTGIGALIIALTSLIAFFKSTGVGAEKLEQIMAGVGAAVDTIGRIFGTIGEKLFNIVTKPKQAINDFIGFLNNTFIKSLKGVGDVITGVLTFDFGKIVRGADNVKGGFDNASKSIKGVAIDFGAMTSAAARAAIEAANLNKQLDNLDDAEREFSVTRAKTKGEIDRLILQAKERTLADDKRVEGLKRAGVLEEELTKQELKFAQERLDIVVKQNAVKAGLQGEDLKRFIELSETQKKLTADELKEFKTLTENKGKLKDEDLQKQVDVQLRAVEIANESAEKQQVIENRTSVFIKELNKERVDSEKETAKKKEEVLTQLNESNIALIKDAQQKEIATVRESLRVKLEAIKGNSQEEITLRTNLEQQSIDQVELIRKKFSEESVQREIDNEKRRISLLLETVKKGTEEEFNLRIEALKIEEQEEINIATNNATERKISEEKLQVELELIRDKFRKIKQDAELKNEEEIFKKVTQARVDQLNADIINLQLASELTTAKKIELATTERDLLLAEQNLTNEKRLLIEAQYQEKLNQLRLQSIDDEVKAIQLRAEIGKQFLSATSSLAEIFGANEATLNEFALQSAIFQISIDTATAVVGAVKGGSDLPFPANILAIATGVATVLANVAKVKKLVEAKPPPPPKFQALAEGGFSTPEAENVQTFSDDPQGFVSKPTLFFKQGAPKFIAGEKNQKEWISPNWMLNNPITAPVIDRLEMFRQKKILTFVDGGFSDRSSSLGTGITKELQTISVETLREVIASMPAPIVTVEDINEKQTQVTRVVSRANVFQE